MVVIGCGGIIIENNQVLLIKRQNSDTFNQMWSNPGGKVELNESLESAVIRELEEEIGVTVKVLEKLTEYQDYNSEKLVGKYTGYLVEIVEGIPYCREPHKISEIRYFSLEDLPENLAPYTKEYLEKLGY